MKNRLSKIRNTVLCIFIYFALLFSGLSFAADYEITKIINIGPAGGPMLGPIKWSPDGTKLSFFRDYNKTLYISDTLGNTQKITSLEISAARYEWLSNDEIIITLRDWNADYDRLVKVDIHNAYVTILKEFTGDINASLDDLKNSFDGPRKTVNGNVYYRTNTERPSLRHLRGAERISPIVIPEGVNLRNDVNKLPLTDYISKWGEDGLYLVNTNLTDSQKIAPKPYKHMPQYSPVLSHDQAYYVQGGTMYRFADSTYIVLDTIAQAQPPESYIAGFMDLSFNPQKTEILFSLVFESDEEELFQIGTYNFVTNDFTLIEPQGESLDYISPVYNDNGNKIAFLSGSNGYIIYRRMQNE
ncbi:MAG: hypothetical protein GY865_14225 [candidate division Zixibacteria bacterium]|nr:hypothetical protein [candidate division Zixibacteria bacterium]